jgi:predicted transcriptional regulator
MASMAETGCFSLIRRGAAGLLQTILALNLLRPGGALGIPTGVQAPEFTLESGDGQKLNRADLAGRVAIILYATRNATGQNQTLRAELERLFAETPLLRDTSSLYVVINCAHAVWPLTLIWRRRLTSSSVEERLTIYGDWDAQMSKDYAMIDNAANLVVLDKSGVVRYFHAGLLSPGEIENVKHVLRTLSIES